MRKSTESDFWAKGKEQGDCIEWQMGKTKDGYGRLNFQGKKWLANRLAYTLATGQIPEGMLVCHSCDNPSCIKPSHLFLGTNADNAQDAVAKGRNARAWQKLITHCPQGHEYTADNTKISKAGTRACKICSCARSKAASKKRRQSMTDEEVIIYLEKRRQYRLSKKFLSKTTQL